MIPASQLLILVRERFSPWVYIPTCVVMALALLGRDFVTNRPLVSAGLCLLVLGLMFLLRCYDEIKDYAEDCQSRPHRPLARGAVSLLALKKAVLPMGLLWTLGALVLAWGQPRAQLLALITWCYSLAMYKEFGIGTWLRPKLTRYALSHTWIMVPLSLYLSTWPSLSFSDSFQRALGLWCLFNLFEFGRKTFAKSEEGPEMSYSKRFGIAGAWLLVLLQIFGAAQFWPLGSASLNTYALVLSLSHLPLILGLILWPQKAVLAKLYRAWCSAYLFLLLLLHCI